MKHSSAAAQMLPVHESVGVFSFLKRDVFLTSKQNSEEILSTCI